MPVQEHEHMETTYLVPAYPLCHNCIPKAVSMHGEVDFDDVCKMCVESQTYRANLDGRESKSVPLDRSGFGTLSERLALKLQGFTADAFKQSHYGVDPEAAGLPSTSEMCPLSGKTQVFWLPREAGEPMYEKHVSLTSVFANVDLRGCQAGSAPAMFKSLANYSTQALASVFAEGARAGIDAKVVRIAKAQGTYPPEVSQQPPKIAMPPVPCFTSLRSFTQIGHQVPGDKRPRQADDLHIPSTPPTNKPRMDVPAASAPHTADSELEVVEVVPSTSHVPAVTRPLGAGIAPRPPSSQAAPGFVSLSQVRGKFASPFKGSTASSAPRSSPSPSPEAGRDLETASMASMMRASLAQEFPDANKYERPILKYTLDLALDGMNMQQAFKDIQRARNTAVKEHSPWAAKLEEHGHLLASGQELFLDRMVEIDVPVIWNHHKLIKPKLPDGKLPKKNYLHMAIRVLLDEIPPRSKSFSPLDVKSLGRLTPAADKRNQHDYDVYNAHVQHKHLDDEYLLSEGGKEIRKGISSHVYSRFVKMSSGGHPHLFRMAHTVVSWVRSLPEPFRTAWCEIAIDACGLLHLFGPVPYMMGSSMDDIEALFSHAGNVQLLALIKQDAHYREYHQVMHMQEVGEREAWPVICEKVDLLDDWLIVGHWDKKSFEVIDTIADQYSLWVSQVRDLAVPVKLHPSLLKVLRCMADEARKDGNEDVLGLADHVLGRLRKFNGLFVKTEETLQHMMEELNEKAKTWRTRRATDRLAKVCGDLVESVAKSDTDAIDARVAAIRDALSPPGDDSGSGFTLGIHMQRDDCWRAFELLADEMVSAQTWQKSVDLAALGTLFSKKVDLNVTNAQVLDSIGQADRQFKVVEKVGVLTGANESYLSLGELAQTRFEKEDSMEKIKAVIAGLDPISTCTVVFEDGLVKTTCDEQRSAAEGYRSEYGELYCGDYRPVLVGEHTKLAAVAAGGPDGVKWKDHVPTPCGYKQLVDNVQDTLGLADINELVNLCSNAAKATLVFCCMFASSFVLLWCVERNIEGDEDVHGQVRALWQSRGE